MPLSLACPWPAPSLSTALYLTCSRMLYSSLPSFHLLAHPQTTMLGLKTFLATLFIGTLLLASVSAQDASQDAAAAAAAAEPIHTEADAQKTQAENSDQLLPIVKDVLVYTEFPNAIEGFLPNLIIGEPNVLKIVFQNDGLEEYKIDMMFGALVNEHDFSEITLNLSTFKYRNKLKANTALAVTYTIKVEHTMTTTGLLLLANLIDSKREHHPIIAFNGTINFTEPMHNLFDIQLLFLYFLLAAMFVGIGIFIKNALASEVKLVKKRAPSLTPEERAAAEEKAKKLDEDWIPEHHKKSPRVTRRRQ